MPRQEKTFRSTEIDDYSCCLEHSRVTIFVACSPLPLQWHLLLLLLLLPYLFTIHSRGAIKKSHGRWALNRPSLAWWQSVCSRQVIVPRSTYHPSTPSFRCNWVKWFPSPSSFRVLFCSIYCLFLPPAIGDGLTRQTKEPLCTFRLCSNELYIFSPGRGSSKGRRPNNGGQGLSLFNLCPYLAGGSLHVRSLVLCTHSRRVGRLFAVNRAFPPFVADILSFCNFS